MVVQWLDSALLLQRSRVRCLVRELRSHKLRGVVKKKHKKMPHGLTPGQIGVGTRAEGTETGHTDTVDLDLGFCPGGTESMWEVGGGCQMAQDGPGLGPTALS